MDQTIKTALPVGAVFRKETLLNGVPGHVDCVEVGGHVLAVSNGPVRIASLEDEWYADLDDPEGVVAGLRAHREVRADIFTFCQRLPDAQPRYAYLREWEDIAALPVSTYDHWWNKQIKSRVRNQIRKAEKEGLVVRETPYDDEFVRGMTAIFNESPVRQGRRFWHYGKDFDTVKRQFSRFAFREYMVGAYFEGEMVGFMMLGNAGRFGLTGQVLSSLNHRDKAPNNSLIAKAVEICAARGLPHLVYFYWTEDSLAEFKRRCGFEKVSLPRYYVPLTWRGELAMRTRAHHGIRGMIPQRFRPILKRVRGRIVTFAGRWA